MTEQETAHWWPKVKEPGPKSTACIFDICENKMPGGETASFAPTRTKSFLSR